MAFYAEPDHDLRVESRFKNALLFRKLDETLGPFWTQSEAAQFCGVRLDEFGAVLRLQIHPLLKNGAVRPVFSRIAEALSSDVANLFPLSLYSLNLPDVVVREYSSPQIISLQEAQKQKLLLPSSEDILAKRSAINKALATLSPREEKLLRLRFGLNGESAYTWEELGEKFGVSRERIHQIEAKALRKLRHPSRTKIICPGTDIPSSPGDRTGG